MSSFPHPHVSTRGIRRSGLPPVARGFTNRAWPTRAVGPVPTFKRDRLVRVFGESPHLNKWSRPPFKYNIEYPWTKWNIRAFQPYEWKHKPASAHCPPTWIKSGIAERLLFMDSSATFQFLKDSFRPIVARCLEGQGYMFTNNTEYDSFHFGADKRLKRQVVKEVEAFMLLGLPPWVYAEVRSMLDLVHWYTRRATMAKPWFQYDIPDGWAELIDAEAQALEGKTLSLYREHVRNSTPAFHTLHRRLNSAETSDWEASHIAYDKIIKSEADFRKRAALVQPARSQDQELWNFQRHVGTSRLPAYSRTFPNTHQKQYSSREMPLAKQVGGSHTNFSNPPATSRPYGKTLSTAVGRMSPTL